MISTWLKRARSAYSAYHSSTLLLAALPLAVAFGSLVDLPLGELHATPTDALVAALVALGIGPTPRPPPHLRMERGSSPGREGGLCDRRRGFHPLAYRYPLAYRALIIVLAALVALMALSLLWATDRALAAKDALKWGEALAVILVAPRWLCRPRDVRLVVGTLVAVALVEALVGIAQGTLLASALPVSADRGVRVVGTFGQPNPYAGYLNLTLPLLLAYVAWGQQRAWRLRCAGMALVLGAALALAQSRGAAVALFAALVAMAWAGWPLVRRWLVGAAAMVAACIVFLLATGRLTIAAFLAQLGWRPLTDAALSHTITNANFSTIERLAHWAAAWRMVAARPWLGVGAGNYPIAYPRYAVPRWPLALGHAHNLYLNLAAELGIFGGLLAIAVAGMTLWLATTERAVETTPKGKATKSAYADWCRWGLLGVMVAVAVHNMFDDLTTHAMLVQQMLILACGLGWTFARLNEIE